MSYSNFTENAKFYRSVNILFFSKKCLPDNFMNSQELQFLNLRNLPARLKAEEVACLLGFKPHEIRLLVAGGLLKPLGRPPTTGVKYFASVAIEECRRDTKWLAQGGRRDQRAVCFTLRAEGPPPNSPSTMPVSFLKPRARHERKDTATSVAGFRPRSASAFTPAALRPSLRLLFTFSAAERGPKPPNEIHFTNGKLEKVWERVQ